MLNKYINDLQDWGWTQAELAEELETNQPKISRLKNNGKADYSLGLRVNELWTKEKKKIDRLRSRGL